MTEHKRKKVVKHNVKVVEVKEYNESPRYRLQLTLIYGEEFNTHDSVDPSKVHYGIKADIQKQFTVEVGSQQFVPYLADSFRFLADKVDEFCKEMRNLEESASK